MYKLYGFAVMLVLTVNFGYAQQIIKGRVIDANSHQGVPGSTIFISEKTQTVTNMKGEFILETQFDQDTIHISSNGYNSQSVALNNDEHQIILLFPSFSNLNEVIVTGNRELQRRTEVPVAINVISKSMINETRATRLDMLINKIPGVYMVDLGNEQHSMSVRQPLGYKSLFLYLEDGIPIRTVGDYNHNALIEINQASLERIEVVKGPASSMFGSEAVGGAINFITQSPSPFLSGKIQAEAGSRGYKRTDFSLSNSIKRFGFFIGGYYANQDQREKEHNDFRKSAITLRGDYTFNEKMQLTAVADYVSYKTDQKGGLDSMHFYSKDYESLYRFTYRKVDAFRLRATLSKDWNQDNKTTLTVFHRNSSIAQNPFYYISDIAANPLKAKGQVNEDAFKSYGTVIQHSKKFAVINSRLIAGVSLDMSPASYNARYTDIDRDIDHVYYQFSDSDSLLTNYNVDLFNSAAYAQFDFKPLNRMKIVLAARYDRLDYEFNNHLLPGAFTGASDTKDHFDHFTPKAGFTYNFGKGIGAYLNYSVGFAPPNITDLYSGVQVPVLKASSYKNYEAGGWLSFASGKGYAEISLYKLDGENEIVNVRQVDGSYQNQNAGKTTHKGVEANLRYAPFKSFTIRLGGTYARHRYIDFIERGKDFSGLVMPQSPPYIFNGEVVYKPAFIKGFRISAEVQGMSRYYTDAQNTSVYKGFTVFNTRAGYRYKGVEVWFNCLNVTDQLYATTVEKSDWGTSYRPGQQRSFQAGIAYNFSKF